MLKATVSEQDILRTIRTFGLQSIKVICCGSGGASDLRDSKPAITGVTPLSCPGLIDPTADMPVCVRRVDMVGACDSPFSCV